MYKYLYKWFFIGFFVVTSHAQGEPVSTGVNEWVKLKTWLQQNYPDHLKRLNPPVNDKAIREAEKKLGYAIPKPLLDLLKVNNGESEDSNGLFGAWRLLPLAEQLLMYEELKQDARFPVAKVHPFLMSGGGDFYCIDIKDGRIIEWLPAGGVNGDKAKSLGTYIHGFMQEVIRGSYVVVEGFNGLVNKKDL